MVFVKKINVFSRRMLAVVILLLCIVSVMMASITYLGTKQIVQVLAVRRPEKEESLEYKMVDGVPQFTKIKSSDCKGTNYVKKKSCHDAQTGELLDGTAGKCGEGVEEWVLDPTAPGYEPAVGTGTCDSDFRPCDVTCNEPCKGDSWIEGACTRDGVVLDGASKDTCGRGMRAYTLDENAPDYKEALGNGKCVKNYSSACDVKCPPNVVPPPACVYASTWQKSANGCVISKEDRARAVKFDEDGVQEYFKLALEAEKCTGEKRLSEWETCKGPPAPVDCKGTWGPDGGWGSCIGSCGSQPTQSRKYTVIREAAHGGTQCPYSHEEKQTRNCGTIVPCPVDCEGHYTDPACPTQCGKAASTITTDWITTKQQVGTGKKCPASKGTKDCPATDVCPVDCKGYYTDPSCPTQCGKGASTLTTRWVTTTAKKGTGEDCPASTSTKSCAATAACPPCVWNECKDWSHDGDPCVYDRKGSLPNMKWNNAMSSYELKGGCENWEMRAYDHENYQGNYFVMQRGGRKNVPHRPHGASVEWNDRVGSVKAVPK